MRNKSFINLAVKFQSVLQIIFWRAKNMKERGVEDFYSLGRLNLKCNFFKWFKGISHLATSVYKVGVTTTTSVVFI